VWKVVGGETEIGTVVSILCKVEKVVVYR